MSSSPEPASPDPPPDPAWKEFARAPLVPVALAVTVGLVADRYGGLPLGAEVLAAVGGLVGWVAAQVYRRDGAAVWLWLAAAGLAALYHHDHRHGFGPDDIGHAAPDRPAPAHVRGTLDEEPTRPPPPRPDPLVAIPKVETTSTVLAVSELLTPAGWKPCSGRVRLTVEGRLDGLHHGDLVQVVGRLGRPHGPSNPGEVDHAGRLRDQRITAELRVKRSADGAVRLEEGWRASLFGWLAAARGWGSRVFAESLPPEEAALASALLLGDTTALDRDGWDRYVRTGVVHVLAISGQHLVILAGFVWFTLQVVGVRRRNGAWLVLGVMVAYTLLTGGRPSAVRAAVMVGVVCLGLVLRRPANRANAFALAWLAVVGLDPADPFTAGCQLSFLSVFVLIWGLGPWLTPRPLTPLEQLVAESRSPSEKAARWVMRVIASAFLVSLVLCAVNAPLILAWQNLGTPIGVVLGPPLVLLTSVALVAGFLLLFLWPVAPWAAWPFARAVEYSLRGCEWLVGLAERVPGGWVYAPGPAPWWLVGFYAGVVAAVLLDGRWRRRVLAGLVAWVAFGLVQPFDRPTGGELRVTFLAVGHGGCVVLETPDGRVLLYDAGTLTGPDVARRVVAPYLWSRGVYRIDEVFLSHADLDHFNGLPELLKRFPVGRVTMTPSFRDKPAAGVAAVLADLDRRRTEVRVAAAGERFDAGGGVTLEVLHPPVDGPPGNENARSLVLLVRHAGHSILLTGDLEGAGQDVLTRTPAPPVDVMLAPHHGAAGANAVRRGDATFSPGPMAAWAKPRLVVSSQADRPTPHLEAAYGAVWDTATVGAVTVRSHSTGLVAETFRTGEVRVVRRGR
ncbi:MAG: ComEC/Rec2 family competence protein [Gemmataceae bacterium]|nr:ComEC/Rec2 family competence protein [Gemmataceae bacterium]